MKIASRMSHLQPHFFAALSARLTALKAAGREIIRLDEGSPDLPPAPHIIQSLTTAAAHPGVHSYQPHRGPQALRQAWADWYAHRFQVQLDSELEVIPLLGSKEGIFHLSQAFLEPGAVALVPDPGYITYTRGALFAGAEVFYFPLVPQASYRPDLSVIPLEVLRRARLLWLNYPNNPTGATAALEWFEEALALGRAYDLLVCHDAAYIEVGFEGEKPPSLLQVAGAKDLAVEFNTLSKSHNMAGWRSGALVGNAEALQTLFTLKTNADSSHFLPIFVASITALTGDQSWLEARNEVYRQRRDAVLAGLSAAGLAAACPRAGLYVWASIPAGWESEAFTIAALENAGVSLTPGTVFGRGGAGFVRIAFTAPLAQIEQAMTSLGDWLASAPQSKSIA